MAISKRHTDVIKAWLDGKQIQVMDDEDRWVDIVSPSFNERSIYRIKPNPKKTLFYRPYIYIENGIVGSHPCWSTESCVLSAIEEAVKNNGIFDSWVGPWVRVEIDET